MRNISVKTKSDILIATDPDCDRLGLVSLDSDGIHYYTGNEVGVLFFDYVYTSLKETGKLPNNPAVVKTIVSTDLINVIAEKLGVEVFEVLTGFKYIGEVIHNLEKDDRKEDYLLGFEESCGYLTNTDVRDKDAVNAAMLCAEMVALLKSKNKTPASRLKEIYDELTKTAYNADIYIMLDTLKYLKKGGRITPAAAAVGELFKIKFDSLIDKLNKEKNISIINGITDESDNLRANCLNEVQKFIIARTPVEVEPGNPEPPEEPEHIIKEVSVPIKEIVFSSKVRIKTEDELNEFLEQVKNRVKNELEDNDIVNLKF